MFFRSKSKQSKIEKKQFSIANLYLDIVSEYIDYKGSLEGIKDASKNQEYFEKEGSIYYKAACYFSNYMREKFPDSLLDSDEVLEIDIEDMKMGMDEHAAQFFYPPTYPSIIYIDDTRFSTHFHISDEVVVGAENVEVLPGISRVIANEKINKLFEGLTVSELKALLSQMHVLPKGSQLEDTIVNHNVLQIIHGNFFKCVIYLILIDRSRNAVKRARLFADSMGVDFDFAPYDAREIYDKKMAL